MPYISSDSHKKAMSLNGPSIEGNSTPSLTNKRLSVLTPSRNSSTIPTIADIQLPDFNFNHESMKLRIESFADLLDKHLDTETQILTKEKRSFLFELLQISCK